MKTEMEGIVLTEQTADDKNRFVTLLTRDRGVVSCAARGSRDVKSSLFAPTQPLCYSRFEVFVGRTVNVIDDAEIIKSFYDLRVSLDRLALTQYISDLVVRNIRSDVNSSEQLDLVLNCFHVLEGQDKSPELIKAVFELRFSSLLGFMPNVVYCEKCGKYESSMMYYNILDNCLYCSECCTNKDSMQKLSKGALAAVRYIILAEPKKLFSFNISGESLRQLSECAEQYMLSVSLSHPKTIDYYKQITNMM